ncbi:DoxX family protein [Robertkochia marina]|uniref:DoxX family protein n=1 Tax=Robertkochia marina TaxID=1227945 RepID=A0A4S3M3N8_9FLAO|nr:DoxX family protein [Robertkochia marina]THD69309.1 DoxX family protein [Robertkochia marina]TRZ47431.1 DoxX family protein [Robertkochia marina]
MLYLKYLILFFVVITFLQSAVDKIADWKGNIAWLKEHFKDSLLDGKVAFSLGIILVLEMLAALTAVGGIWFILSEENETLAVYSLLLSGVTLLFLLLGQRLAKDYDGARTIVIYLIPVFFGLYLFTQ